jgi:hypothetical protein
MKRTLAVMFVVLIASSGCTYLENRGKDFLDCFKFSADAGLGISAGARVFSLGGGIGYWDGISVGLDRKGRTGVWNERYAGWPFNMFLCRDSWWPFGLIVTSTTKISWLDMEMNKREYGPRSYCSI